MVRHRPEIVIPRWVKQPVSFPARNHPSVRKPVVATAAPLLGPVGIDMIVARVSLSLPSLQVILQYENEKTCPVGGARVQGPGLVPPAIRMSLWLDRVT